MQLSTDYTKFYLDGECSDRFDLLLITTESDSATSITGLRVDLDTEESVNGTKIVTNQSNEDIKFNIKFTKYKSGQNGTFEIEDIDKINRWLFAKKGVRELRVGNRIYYGYFTSGEKWIQANRQGYLKYEFTMPNGFVILKGNENIICNGKRTIKLENRATGEEYSNLAIEIYNITSNKVKITNITNSQYIEITDLNNTRHIYINSDIDEIYDKNNLKDNIFKNTTYKDTFPTLEYGENTIKIEGKCYVKFSWDSKMCL